MDCAAQNAAKRPSFPDVVKRLRDIKVGEPPKEDSDEASEKDSGGAGMLMTMLCVTTIEVLIFSFFSRLGRRFRHRQCSRYNLIHRTR